MKPSVSKKPPNKLLMGDSKASSEDRCRCDNCGICRLDGGSRRKWGQYGPARRHSTADWRGWPHREALISPRFARDGQGPAATISPLRAQAASESATNASVADSGGGRLSGFSPG